ncbi:MAG: FAD-dependent oxidoreductase, partial [Candidatus Solibacter sp.]|nr:FAD-dependent oxidoreductase [Candidatus Solibacter sp.]
TELLLEVRRSSVRGNFTPDCVMHRQAVRLEAGSGQPVVIRPTARIEAPQYMTYCLLRNPAVSVHTSDFRITGVLSLSQSMNKAVAKGARQEPPADSGIDSFEFWLPSRRPGGQNLAMTLDPAIDAFGPENVQNGMARPTTRPNAWVAAAEDQNPCLSLRWAAPKNIRRIELSFDTDFDHPMESVLMGHPEREIPFCVKRYRIRNDTGQVIFESAENHQTRNHVVLAEPVRTAEIQIEILETRSAPAAVFEVRCYED